MQENPILVCKKQDNEWGLFTHKVEYVENGTEQVAYTNDPSWYQTFEQMHSNFNVVNITEVTYTSEQLARLEEIKNMSITDTVANDYVIEGIHGDGLEMFALQKENNELKELLADLAELVLLGGA